MLSMPLLLLLLFRPIAEVPKAMFFGWLLGIGEMEPVDRMLLVAVSDPEYICIRLDIR